MARSRPRSACCGTECPGTPARSRFGALGTVVRCFAREKMNSTSKCMLVACIMAAVRCAEQGCCEQHCSHTCLPALDSGPCGPGLRVWSKCVRHVTLKGGLEGATGKRSSCPRGCRHAPLATESCSQNAAHPSCHCPSGEAWPAVANLVQASMQKMLSLAMASGGYSQPTVNSSACLHAGHKQCWFACRRSCKR